MIYIAFFGEGKEFKDAYKAAKAIRTFAGKYGELHRYSGQWGSVVVWDSRYYNMHTYREDSLGDIIKRYSNEGIVYVTKRNNFIGII